MATPHVLAIPYPAQGHVIPLMEVSLWLVKHGIKVTFVNTESNHERVIKSLSETENSESVNLVSIPDGLEPWEDRNELGKLYEAILNVMPGKLENLIQKINETDRDKIVCVIADFGMGWALELTKKLGFKTVAFCPAAAAMLNLAINCPKLIDSGIIDSDGRVLKKQMFQLSPAMPVMNPETTPWTCIGDLATQKIMYHCLINNFNSANEAADRSICNSTYELEPAALALIPNCKPIGPLLANYRLGNSSGHFWPQDSTCLEWLDKQPSQSVIYVAFGSFTIFNETQFQELAHGLELTNRPFLWVVRQDVSTVQSTLPNMPEGFEDRVQNRGLMVSWAPQQKVLSHPSVACFLSHCGWNSTMEGVSNGVPFLCWPYFADQHFNQTYICDHWEVGLGLDRDEMEIIRKEEIKNKLEQLLTDERYKERALNLQAKIMASATKGSSHKNFNNFVEWIKEKGKHSL